MRFKILLPIVLLVSFAALLTFCTKEEPVVQAPATEFVVDSDDFLADALTSDRAAACTLWISAQCTLKVCGTLTNAYTCTACSGGTLTGIEAVTYAQYIFTQPVKIRVFNPNSTPCTFKIKTSATPTQLITLNANQSQDFKVYSDCTLGVGPTCY